jgi:hypothetical protein
MREVRRQNIDAVLRISAYKPTNMFADVILSLYLTCRTERSSGLTPMSAFPEKPQLQDHGPARRWHFLAPFRRFWPLIIELWIAGVLVAFFVIRIMGSRLAQRLLERLGLGHR